MNKLMAILTGLLIITMFGGMMISNYYKYDLKRIALSCVKGE